MGDPSVLTPLSRSAGEGPGVRAPPRPARGGIDARPALDAPRYRLKITFVKDSLCAGPGSPAARAARARSRYCASV